MSEDPTSNAPFPSSQFRDDRNKPVRHIAPSSGASIDSKTTWFLHALASSRTYLANQPSYRDIEEGIKLIEEESPRIRVNRLKRQMREVVASLSQIRVQGWTVRTDNRDFDNQAGDITKLLAGWFHETNVTRRIRSAMQWACATGTGYLSPRYDPAYHTATRGDVELDVLGAQDVFPVQLPKSGDLQAAYAVMMRTQIGTEDARNRYPEFAQDIQADPMPRQSQSSRALRVMAHLVSPLKAFMGNEPGSPSPAQAETVSLFQVYIRDSTINNSGNDISMGTGNWQYTVPPLGKLIPSGFRDPEGHMTMRKAGPADCRLYPTRRLMVFLGSIAPVLVYDNASPHWFAKVPLVRFRVDDWPWLSLGFSLAHDGRSLQKAHTSIMDSIIQAVKCRLDPHLTYTKQA
ncbi:MAG: hypothetical protein ACRD22_17655, partial [Terriglobia bacterium]